MVTQVLLFQLLRSNTAVSGKCARYSAHSIAISCKCRVLLLFVHKHCLNMQAETIILWMMFLTYTCDNIFFLISMGLVVNDSKKNPDCCWLWRESELPSYSQYQACCKKARMVVKIRQRPVGESPVHLLSWDFNQVISPHILGRIICKGLLRLVV